MGLLFNRKDLGETYDEIIDDLGVDIDFEDKVDLSDNEDEKEKENDKDY